MTKAVETPEVQEGEFTEVEEPKGARIKCQVSVGITEEGHIYFDVDGYDQSLITAEGLLRYAERHMSKTWEERLAKQASKEAK